jgi:hypothetical protein
MPIKPENRGLYPADWKQISIAAKERAGWRCAHPGCTARQYSVGRWLADIWTPHVDYAESYGQARQYAAEYAFFLFGDGPAPKGEAKVIVIVLTVAHLNHDPGDCRPENLAAMCQRHHLAYDQQHHNETAYATRMAKRGNMELPL